MTVFAADRFPARRVVLGADGATVAMGSLEGDAWDGFDIVFRAQTTAGTQDVELRLNQVVTDQTYSLLTNAVLTTGSNILIGTFGTGTSYVNLRLFSRRGARRLVRGSHLRNNNVQYLVLGQWNDTTTKFTSLSFVNLTGLFVGTGANAATIAVWPFQLGSARR